MLRKSKKIIRVATMAELTNQHYYSRLWLSCKNLKQVSRRKWLDELAACFRDCDCEIVYPSGQPYPIPYVDELFGDDPDMRWVSYFLKSDPTGTMPKAMSRKMERVQILDLYFRIKYEHIQKHFSR